MMLQLSTLLIGKSHSRTLEDNTEEDEAISWDKEDLFPDHDEESLPSMYEELNRKRHAFHDRRLPPFVTNRG